MNIALLNKQKKLAKFMQKTAQEKHAKEQNVFKGIGKNASTKNTSRHRDNVSAQELKNDLERLSEIDEIPEKIDYKKTALIPKYMDIVKAYRESGERHTNEMLVYLIIWLIDVELIEEAIELADFAIEQGQSMPERFKRDLPTYVAEEICTWAERQHKAGLSASPYLDHVAERLIKNVWPVGQKIVLNKVYKLMGLYAEQNTEWSQAVHWFEHCVACNPEGHGVKTKLATAKKLAEPH